MESILNDLAQLDAASWATIPELDRAAVEAEFARETAEMLDMGCDAMMQRGGVSTTRNAQPARQPA